MQTFRFLNKAISGSVFYNHSHKLNHNDGDSCLLCFQILLCHCIEVVNKVLTKCFILQRCQLYNQCNLGIVFMIITTSQSNIAVIQCLECMLLMLWILLCIEVTVLAKCFILQRYQLSKQWNLWISFKIITIN